MTITPRSSRIVRRVTGGAAASWRVPARTPLLIERHQVRFDTLTVPPLPSPVFMVQTAGKPIAYQSERTAASGRSIPGLVTLQPRGVRTEVVLAGVGEACLIFFENERNIPAWALRIAWSEAITFHNEVIAALTRRLMQAIDAEEGRSSYLRTLGNALLAELEHASTQAARERAEWIPAKRGGLRVAHTAMRHIDAHLGERLRVTGLAKLCGLGATSFSRQFRSACGESPHQYLKRRRIDRACELLRTTSLSVREVGESVGYAGQSHFCVAFGRERGMSPSAYRRESTR